MPVPPVADVGIPPFDPLPSFIAARSQEELSRLTTDPPARPESGDISVEAEVRRSLARIENLDAGLRAFIHVASEGALTRARELDRHFVRHGPLGSLHGFTLAVKDCIDVAGLPTTCGTQDGAQRPIPTRTASSVRVLEQAGAVVVGKTNLHEWAFGATSDNPWFGRVVNPWHPDRGPGGSSGGSAVAVATGMARVALGTDTGGSVRIPAAYCRIFGHKPTLGRVDLAGVEPLSWTLDTVGPLANDVLDLAAVDRLLGSTGRARSEVLSSPAKPLTRVAVLTGAPFLPQSLDPIVASAFDQMIDCLARDGVSVVHLDLPELNHVRDAFFPIVLAEGAVVHGGERRLDRERYGADIRSALEEGDAVSASTYIAALRWRNVLAEAIARAVREADVEVLLAPVSALPPLSHLQGPIQWPDGQLEPAIEAAARLCLPASLAGLPATAVPIPAALPVGLQVIGRAGQDERVIAAAAWLVGRLSSG